MKIIPAKISGMFYIDLEPRFDDRGYFRRAFCVDELSEAGIVFQIVQINQALTKQKHVIRGLHWQAAPDEEAKIFQCLEGKIIDVVADVRRDSPTYGQWESVELAGDSYRILYIPGGVAHGYETLEENCLVQYSVSHKYSPQSEKGIRWNDPFFNIVWPASPAFLSPKDSGFPDFIHA